MFKKAMVVLMLAGSLAISSQVGYAKGIDSSVVEIHPVGSVCVGTAQLSFNISDGGVAKSTAVIRGKAGTSKIVMKMFLQKYNSTAKTWSNVQNWETSSQTAICSSAKSYGLKQKGTYRCKVTATVTCNGTAEKVTKISDSIKY